MNIGNSIYSGKYLWINLGETYVYNIMYPTLPIQMCKLKTMQVTHEKICENFEVCSRFIILITFRCIFSENWGNVKLLKIQSVSIRMYDFDAELIFERTKVCIFSENWGLAKNLEETFANLIQTLASEDRVLNPNACGVRGRRPEGVCGWSPLHTREI